MHSLALFTEKPEQWNKLKDTDEPEDPGELDIQVDKRCDKWDELLTE